MTETTTIRTNTRRGSSSSIWTIFVACALVLIGLGLFGKGFFLTRVELKDAGACLRNEGSGICNVKSKFDKAVIIVIDALRLDFVLPSTLTRLHDDKILFHNVEDIAKTKSSSTSYLNKLVTLRNLLGQRPNHTFIARLDADPPTTTMQRLKGIVTGGLPTFIDIKDDVASEKIFEDNLLAQFKRRKRKVTFMGDDTWVKLFPDSLSKQFPYESFNVKDLDTLDTGVMSHLFPEMKNSDWDVLVAHFLGVDHAGHRYGPRHSEMTRKLIQMDDVLDRLIKEMDRNHPDSILLVFGDHGMTEDGNHGGATDEERSAALFAYSPRKRLFGGLAEGLKREGVTMIQQIDLAPTLALLLDVPIPFGNLGFLVPELVCDDPKDWPKLVRSATLNANQILLYLKTYASRKQDGGGIPKETLLRWQRTVDSLIEEKNHEHAFDVLRKVAREAAEEARQLWTQFNLPFMNGGTALALVGVLGLAVLALPVHLGNISVAVGWLLGLFALLSNSYIVAESSVSAFVVSTNILVMCRSRHPKELARALLQLCIVRASVPFGDDMRATGHEVRDLTTWIVFGAVPLVLIVGFNLRNELRQQGVFAVVVILQALLCIGFWFASVLKIPGNSLAQLVYLLSIGPGLYFAKSLDQILLGGVTSLALILGPLGAYAIAGFLVMCRFSSAANQSPFWRGVLIGQLVILWFFATGHSCVFGSLRITAPYVGFEHFGYWRGVVMLTLDTFGVHLLGVAQAVRERDPKVLVGFLLVMASRALVTTCFVYFARRHLMVWAIFAPKFIFDSCAFVASFVFAILLIGIRKMKGFDDDLSQVNDEEKVNHASNDAKGM